MTSPYVIGIAGPSGAGKSYLARHLADALGGATIVALDSYYPDLSHVPVEERTLRNFDDPESLDSRLMISQLRDLAAGQTVHRPIYDFGTHTRTGEQQLVQPSPYIVAEGIYALHWPELRDLFHARVFVDAPEDTCFARRLERDIRERGRSEESVRRQYRETVAPMTAQHVRPAARYADILLSGMDPVTHEVNAILEHIRRVTKGHLPMSAPEPRGAL